MVKPLTYYVSGCNGFFDGLTSQYGPHLHRINVDEKLMMLATIFYAHLIGGDTEDSLSILDDGQDTPSNIVEILQSIESFEPTVQFDFCWGLLEQVKEQYRLQAQFAKQLSQAGVDGDVAEEVAGIIASGGDRSPDQISLVEQAWQQIQTTNPRLAERIEQAMSA